MPGEIGSGSRDFSSEPQTLIGHPKHRMGGRERMGEKAQEEEWKCKKEAEKGGER